MRAKTVPFDVVKEELLENPETRREYERLEPYYQVARLRIQRGLTQKELAERVGTKQPSIARLESGRTKPSLPFLEKIAKALGGNLTVTITEGAGPTTNSCRPHRSRRAVSAGAGTYTSAVHHEAFARVAASSPCD